MHKKIRVSILVCSVLILVAFFGEDSKIKEAAKPKQTEASKAKSKYDQYHYRIDKVVKIYDGDTITVDIDLGFGIVLRNQMLRLYGVDTPELRGEEKVLGYKVRDEVRKMIAKGYVITIKTIKDKKGKYGRWIVVVFIDGKNLNKHLIKSGYGQEY